MTLGQDKADDGITFDVVKVGVKGITLDQGSNWTQPDRCEGDT